MTKLPAQSYEYDWDWKNHKKEKAKSSRENMVTNVHADNQELMNYFYNKLQEEGLGEIDELL